MKTQSTKIKKIKQTITVLSFALLGLAIFGCNNKSNDNPPPQQTSTLGLQPGISPYCPPGATFSSYGTCVGLGGMPYPIPYGQYSGAAGFYSENWNERKLRISDSFVFIQFLKSAMGVCDRMQYAGGLSACEAWSNGYLDVTVQSYNTQSNNVRVTFRAWPKAYPGGWWAGQFPNFGDFVAQMFGFPTMAVTGAVRNPLVLDMVVSLINNSNGFEARGYGDYWTTASRSLIQVVVPNGKFEQSGFNYQIAFGNQATGKGKVFATGWLTRCSRPDCGSMMLWGN